MKIIKIHQHHISEFLNCRERFNLAENLCIEPRFQKKEINLGSAFHEGVREFKKGNKDFLVQGWKYFDSLKAESQEELEQIQWGKAVVTAMLMGYSEKYKFDGELDVEKKISQTIDGIKLIATPDSIEGSWIGEEKTTSKLDQDYVEKLPLDFQMSFYFLLASKFYRKKFDGIIYRITRVTALRQKAKQTFDQYLKEIAQDYISRPEWYFICEKLYRSQDDIERFKTQLIWQVKDLMDCYKTNRWYRSTSQCTKWGGCYFRKYCVDPTEETLKTYFMSRQDTDRCFSVMNKIKVDRPSLQEKERTPDTGTTTPATMDDLPF